MIHAFINKRFIDGPTMHSLGTFPGQPQDRWPCLDGLMFRSGEQRAGSRLPQYMTCQRGESAMEKKRNDSGVVGRVGRMAALPDFIPQETRTSTELEGWLVTFLERAKNGLLHLHLGAGRMRRAWRGRSSQEPAFPRGARPTCLGPGDLGAHSRSRRPRPCS